MAGASAVAVPMIFASSLALGLSLLSVAGGALGGYIAGRRWQPGSQPALGMDKPIKALLGRRGDQSTGPCYPDRVIQEQIS